MIVNIWKIIKEGYISLYYNINGDKRPIAPIVLWYIILPLAIGIYSYINQTIFTENTINLLISVFSIFTALIFGIIFIAPDKFAKRIEVYKKSIADESISNYLIRYENFTKGFVKQIALLIVYSIVIIILLVITQIHDVSLFKIIIHSIVITFFSEFILLTFNILSYIYILLIDDIENSSKNKRE